MCYLVICHYAQQGGQKAIPTGSVPHWLDFKMAIFVKVLRSKNIWRENANMLPHLDISRFYAIYNVENDSHTCQPSLFKRDSPEFGDLVPLSRAVASLSRLFFCAAIVPWGRGPANAHARAPCLVYTLLSCKLNNSSSCYDLETPNELLKTAKTETVKPIVQKVNNIFQQCVRL